MYSVLFPRLLPPGPMASAAAMTHARAACSAAPAWVHGVQGVPVGMGRMGCMGVAVRHFKVQEACTLDFSALYDREAV